MRKFILRLFSFSRPFPQTQKLILGNPTNMKTFIHLLLAVLLFILLLLESAFAGAPPLKWQNTLGGSDHDFGYWVQQTSDAGYIIAGWTNSYGAGNWDVYLIKTCSDGTLSADFNCNGTVYYEDLELLLAQWLQPPDILSADIAPEPGDGIVNAFVFAALAHDWLQTTSP